MTAEPSDSGLSRWAEGKGKGKGEGEGEVGIVGGGGGTVNFCHCTLDGL